MRSTGIASRLAPILPARRAAVAQCGRAVGAHVDMVPLSADDPGFALAWDALAAAASEPNVFAERWFVAAGVRNLNQGAGARFVRIWVGDGDRRRLIGLFPVEIRPRYGRMPFRHVQNWLHYHSFLGTPLLRAGYEQAAWVALLTALDDAPWAPGLLHLNGLVESGPVYAALVRVAAMTGRPCDVVHRIERALLQSDLTPIAYYEATVRKKKRKEIKRLQNRLAELGDVSVRRLGPEDDLDRWCDDFLRLERSGWKGRAGSALAETPATARFFREVAAGAQEAGRLEMISLNLDGNPIAMLVNLYAPPGAFSFKTAFDERFARFSPGVLLQLDNLAILSRPDVAWVDSCAAEHHPMIDSLWGQRRAVVRVSVRLKGWRRGAAFRLARAAENAASAVKTHWRAASRSSTEGEDAHA